MVLVVGLIFMAQFFTSAAARLLAADTRTVMHQIANSEVEAIRGMQYEDVGTVGGWPAGSLDPMDDDKVVEGRHFRVERDITYVEDPSYAALNGGQGGPFPANYRRATVRVFLKTGTTVSQSIEPVEMSTDVAGGTQGGSIDLTVTDTAGEPVPGGRVVIKDNLLVPSVLIDTAAMRTNTDGKLLVPGLTPDKNGGYQVRASKSGYNSAELKESVVVVSGVPFTVVQLIIDKLCTLRLHVTDGKGAALAGVVLTVTGSTSVSPFTFSQTVTTDQHGYALLENIRYSTSLEPCFVTLATAHTPPLQLPAGVTAPEIDGKFLPLPAGKIPVVLDAGETQTVELVVPPS
jgi:hypothetical protein